MNLFGRLRKIVRANIHASLEDTVASELSEDFCTEQHFRFRKEPADGQQASSQVSVDATLARYYANLEVPCGSDLATVRAAWKRLVRKYHPDLHSNDAEKRRVANELTQGLNHAYEELVKRLKK
ncbi:MAG: DnaJ family molecular chaperone [bacterium]